MKSVKIVIFTIILPFLASSAFANECTPEIGKVDQQFTTTNPLPVETLTQAKKLRDQAFALCESGSIQQGLAILNEAKALLGIQ